MMPRIVLFDADVISHFIANDMLPFVPAICAPHKMVILEAVYLEVILKAEFKDVLDNFLAQFSYDIGLFPSSNIDMNMEFARIKRNSPLIGDGERALMAHAKFNGDVIASSNFTDVASYCTINNIDLLGTLDVLAIGIKKKILTNTQCDDFITAARNKNHARFPVNVTRISDYSSTKLNLLD